MSESIRDAAIRNLEQEWGGLTGRFAKMSKPEQTAYLQKQGYERLADLLAHVMVWWAHGLQNIAVFLRDADFQPAEVDVDKVNAQAVEDVRGEPEEQVAARFEQMIARASGFLRELSDAELADPRVIKQLDMEFTGHWGEHKPD